MKLEEIEKLCEEATPAPWGFGPTGCLLYEILGGVTGEYKYGPGSTSLPTTRIVVSAGDSDKDYAVAVEYYKDAKFIAASRALIPKLIAVAKAVRYHVENGIVDPHDRLKKALGELEEE